MQAGEYGLGEELTARCQAAVVKTMTTRDTVVAAIEQRRCAGWAGQIAVMAAESDVRRRRRWARPLVGRVAVTQKRHAVHSGIVRYCRRAPY